MGGPQPGQRTSSPVQLQPITAEDVVEGDVVKAEEDTPVQNVVAEMADEDVGSVIVVDDGRPTGVLTDRSIALALEDSPDVAEQTAGDLAGGDPITATPDATLFDILEMMGQEGIRRVPIVDEEGQLQGVVSLDDVIVVLGSELGNAAETIESQVGRL